MDVFHLVSNDQYFYSDYGRKRLLFSKVWKIHLQFDQLDLNYLTFSHFISL